MRRLLITATICWLFASSDLSFATRQSIVFFVAGDATRLDPEQWRITPEGASIIADAASAHQLYGGFIVLIGADHRVGAAEEAIERSRRRAEAVKDALIAQGVPAAMIVTVACGYALQFVETIHGVKEPQNRFVLFSFEASKEAAEKAAAEACVPFDKPRP